MLIFSTARITVRGGDIRVEGVWKRYAARIRRFLRDLPLEGAVIRYRFGRFVFSRSVRPSDRQRIRNFLGNECPLRN